MTAKKTGPHLKPGRKTAYRAEYVKQAAKLCTLGVTDEDLAMFFDVTISTITLWKLKHPAFSSALKVGKELADTKVERSLYNRAVGYSYPSEKLVTVSGGAGEPSYVERHNITVHVPPDVTAQIFWLKNRKRNEWRDVHTREHTVQEEMQEFLDDLAKTPRLPEINRQEAKLIELARAEATDVVEDN